MVNKKDDAPRCGACREVFGEPWRGFVFCHYLKQEVWSESLMCEHGKDLEEIF